MHVYWLLRLVCKILQSEIPENYVSSPVISELLAVRFQKVGVGDPDRRTQTLPPPPFLPII